MVEKKAKVISSVAGLLGLLSVALFTAAEATTIKASQIQFTSSSTCIYPTSPAFTLGLIGAVSLTIAQIIITIAAGCFCCILACQPNSSWTLAVVCFVNSWVGFVAVFVKLLSGAAPHGHHGNATMYFGTHPCYFVKSGLFADISALSFVGVAHGIAYYLVLESVKISNKAGTAKVHPQDQTSPP